MTAVVSRLDVRPVGQGAFIRGQAEIYNAPPWSPPSKTIRWIYDCGTDSKEEIIDASVYDLGASWPYKEKIDFLIISHFDKDHISGLPTLLRRYTFTRILMPHLPRLVRLLAAVERIEDEAPGRLADILDLADDPVNYIRTNGGDDTQIILVEAPEGPDYFAPGDLNHGDHLSDSTSLLDEELLGEQTRRDAGSAGDIRTIASGRPIVLDPAWEIIPYVDHEVRTKLLNFDLKDEFKLTNLLNQVLQSAGALTATDIAISDHPSDTKVGKSEVKDKKTMQTALKQAIYSLKQAVYNSIEAKIGTKPTAKHKNAISLIAYLGAAITNQLVCSCIHVEVGVGPANTDRIDNYAGKRRKGSGWLLAGDADLSDAGAVNRLVAHMTDQRIETLGVFQVPHHGSRHNSSQDTANKLSAPFNVFNANPHGRHGHPDGEVVDRYSSAVLVNARAFEEVSVVSDDAQYADPHLWCCSWVVNAKSRW